MALGVAGGRASEFFGAQHGDDEIDEEAEGDEADDDVFHGGSLAGDGGGGLGLYCRSQRIFPQKRA